MITFEAFITQVCDEAFRDLLIVPWETGCQGLGHEHAHSCSASL